MSGNQERFQEAMKQGHSAAWEQEWEKAAAFYRQALDEQPENSTALNSLGLACYEQEAYGEALRWYLKAAKVSPEDPLPLEKVAGISERLGNHAQAAVIYMRAGDLYAKNRDLEKGLENWARVTELQPENVVAHSRLAVVNERTGKKQQAVLEYIALAGLMQHGGDLPKAIQALTHALKVLPESKEASRALAILKAGQRLPRPARPPAAPAPKTPQLAAGARMEEQQALEDEEFDPVEEARREALAVLAGLLFDQEIEEPEPTSPRRGLGAIVRGLDAHAARQADQTRILLHLSQAVDLQSREQPSEAILEIERAIEAGLEHPAAYFDMGLLLAQSGQAEAAIPALQRSLKDLSLAVGSRLLLAGAFYETGRLKEAAAAYLEALLLADEQTLPDEQAGELRQIYEPLVESYLQNNDETFLQSLCTNIRELLRRPGWRSHLKKARERLPGTRPGGPPVPLAEILGEARGSKVVEAITRIHEYSRKGFQRAAMEEAFFALQYAPTYLPLHIQIGDLLVEQHRLQPAVEKYSMVARSYSNRGDNRRAVEMLQRVTDLSPMDTNARTQLIEHLREMGRSEDAVGETIRLGEMYYNMADLTQARQTYSEALRLVQQMRLDGDWKGKILHRMADIDLQSLDWRQALRVFEQIRSVQPADESARASLVELNLRLGQGVQALAELDNYLSYLWSNGQKQQAISFVENLIKESPDQAAIRRRLAELYRQVGQVEQAVEQLDEAGDLLIKLGDRAGAIETIKAIVALQPSNVESYQQLLAELKNS